MQHRGEANASTEMPRVGRNRGQRLGRGLEQKIVDQRLVLVGDIGDGDRQCEHHVEVWHRQQFGFALSKPLTCSSALTLWAVSIAAGVVGNGGIGTILAARDVAAQRRRAAALDGRHHLELAEADMAGVSSAPCRSMAAEDIRDLQNRARHAPRFRWAV